MDRGLSRKTTTTKMKSIPWILIIRLLHIGFIGRQASRSRCRKRHRWIFDGRTICPSLRFHDLLSLGRRHTALRLYLFTLYPFAFYLTLKNNLPGKNMTASFIDYGRNESIIKIGDGFHYLKIQAGTINKIAAVYSDA